MCYAKSKDNVCLSCKVNVDDILKKIYVVYAWGIMCGSFWKSNSAEDYLEGYCMCWSGRIMYVLSWKDKVCVILGSKCR